MHKFGILIPDGENEHTLWVTRSLAHAGHVNLNILSDRQWAPVRFSRHRHLYRYRATGSDYGARLRAVREIIDRADIDVILPVGEEGVLFAASERQALARLAALPPLPTVEALSTARNKWLLNQFAQREGLPAPASALVTLDDSFERQVLDLEFPVLLKPTSLTDGQGIMRFDTLDSLRQFLDATDRASLAGRYLAQSYIPGADVGLSVLCRDGELLAWTIQQGIISAAHRFGPLMAMEFIHDDDVLQTGQKLVAALRWSGVAHIDLRRDVRDGKAKVIEVNARYWGSLLGSTVAGVNFPYLASLAAQGIEFPAPAYRNSRYAYTTTVIKEGVRALLGKSCLPGLAFGETGLRFFVLDPFPEMFKRLFLPWEG